MKHASTDGRPDDASHRDAGDAARAAVAGARAIAAAIHVYQHRNATPLRKGDSALKSNTNSR
jgi:hypothetical protein